MPRLRTLDVIGPIACALMIGLLVGFCIGSVSALKSLPECILRAD